MATNKEENPPVSRATSSAAEECRRDIDAWFESYSEMTAIPDLVSRLLPVYERAQRPNDAELLDAYHAVTERADRAEAALEAEAGRIEELGTKLEEAEAARDKLRNTWKLALVNEELSARRLEEADRRLSEMSAGGDSNFNAYISDLHFRLHEAEAACVVKDEALRACVIVTSQGQPCYRTADDVPQGMPRKVERIVRAALAVGKKEE